MTAPATSGSRSHSEAATIEPAHAVTHQVRAQARMLGADGGEHGVEIVEKVPEAADVPAHALRAAVPLMVVGVHGAAARREPGADVLVASRVLGEAVHQQQHALGSLDQPGAPEQRPARRRRELRFHAPDAARLPVQSPGRGSGDRRGAQDSACRRTASRAARTRAR